MALLTIHFNTDNTLMTLNLIDNRIQSMKSQTLNTYVSFIKRIKLHNKPLQINSHFLKHYCNYLKQNI